MINLDDALAILRNALGNSEASFRDGQWEAIDALVNRKERLLVVERTGWGKSSVYFIATRILRDHNSGPTLIVSPLLSLMRNQTRAAQRYGVHPQRIDSTNQGEWPGIKNAVRSHKVDALLISPERLANDEFMDDVLLPIAGNIGLLVIDEVHCISDWGHDFRPDYRRLISIIQRIPDNVPVLGTTATASKRVVADVQEQMGNVKTQRGPLMRSTLSLQTLRLPSHAERLAWLAEHIGDLPGSGVIYTLTTRDADQVAEWLNIKGHVAKAYYAGVTNERFHNSDDYREHLEDLLLKNKIKALVATVALGMGFDKPDLGFVVHYQAPGSAVAYYQQVGRAGRGINHAVGILMSGSEDADIHDYFRRSAFPHESVAKRILNALEESDGLTTGQIEERINLRERQIKHALKYLSVDNPATVIRLKGNSGWQWQRTTEPFRMDHERTERLTRQREYEWRQIQSYIDEAGCLMRYLAVALDDNNAQACGKCVPCRGGPVVNSDFSREGAIEASRFLRKAVLPLKCKVQVAKNAFVEYKFKGKFPVKLRAETGRILSRWRDAGWGTAVAEDKGKGHFRDELVDAVAKMIRAWKPSPMPAWVACVSSKNHPNLVPDFAKRLANQFSIPFMPVVNKIRDNEPQKEQQNRHHQCRNLDGVFRIDGEIPDKPVLLVDDVVDSRWTLTVVAALLRRAGSGPVWPIALTTSGIEE